MPELFSARLAMPARLPALAPQLVSVVVPLFDEHENLPHLYRRLIAALTEPFELVFVNDGSRDATPAMLDALAATDPRVVAVHLSRNFGHQPAVCAGLSVARGAAVVVMDGDLQDPPEVLPQFLARWRAGAEVVYAVRTKRKEGVAKRLGYFVFYRLLRRVSDLPIPLDAGDFCLMDRRVVDALAGMPERERFVRGLRTFAGFRQEGLVYERDARAAGTPKYTFRKLVGLAADGLFNFSGFPLRLVAWLGAFALVVALVLGGVALASLDKLLAVASLGMFACGVQLLALGIVGEYVRRIFLEVKARPPYIVREVVRHATRNAA